MNYVTIFLYGVLAGFWSVDWVWRKAAVRHGHAEYVIGTNGRRKWQWKQQPAKDAKP